MDAKLMMSLGATRDSDGAADEGNWTESMKAFSGKLYRPDVAPADWPVTESPASPNSEPLRPSQPAPSNPPRNAPTPPTSAQKPAPALNNPLFEAIPPRNG